MPMGMGSASSVKPKQDKKSWYFMGETGVFRHCGDAVCRLEMQYLLLFPNTYVLTTSSHLKLFNYNHSTLSLSLSLSRQTNYHCGPVWSNLLCSLGWPQLAATLISAPKCWYYMYKPLATTCFFLFYMCGYFAACMYEYPHMSGAYEGQKRELDPLKLELHGCMPPCGGQDLNQAHLARVTSVLNCCATSTDLALYIFIAGD